MPAFDDLLTDDESVAIKAAGDFAVLVPAHQRAAFGTDGSLSGWDLTTAASVGGLGAGHVVALERGSGGDWRDLLAVEGVATAYGESVIALRRIGMDAGDGAPPIPPAGTTALRFFAPTARPQIVQATRDVLRRFNLGSYDAIGQALDGAGDPEDFRPLATLLVLLTLLGTQHRAGNMEENFHTKYKDLLAERDALASDLIDHYGIPTRNRLKTGVVRLPNYRTTTESEFG